MSRKSTRQDTQKNDGGISTCRLVLPLSPEQTLNRRRLRCGDDMAAVIAPGARRGCSSRRKQPEHKMPIAQVRLATVVAGQRLFKGRLPDPIDLEGDDRRGQHVYHLGAQEVSCKALNDIVPPKSQEQQSLREKKTGVQRPNQSGLNPTRTHLLGGQLDHPRDLLRSECNRPWSALAQNRTVQAQREPSCCCWTCACAGAGVCVCVCVCVGGQKLVASPLTCLPSSWMKSECARLSPSRMHGSITANAWQHWRSAAEATAGLSPPRSPASMSGGRFPRKTNSSSRMYTRIRRAAAGESGQTCCGGA